MLLPPQVANDVLRRCRTFLIRGGSHARHRSAALDDDGEISDGENLGMPVYRQIGVHLNSPGDTARDADHRQLIVVESAVAGRGSPAVGWSVVFRLGPKHGPLASPSAVEIEESHQL